MKNQLKPSLNFSEVGIEEYVSNKDNTDDDLIEYMEDNIANTENNNYDGFDEFPDQFDDSNLTFRPEFIERMKELEKETPIPLKRE